MTRLTGAPDQRTDSRLSTQEDIVDDAHIGQPLGVVSRPAGYRMINSLEIENFRPFKKLSLSGLKRLNVVVGDNSSGKTAFLEAAFLASASSPQIPMTLRQWRGLETGITTTALDIYDAIWGNLFHNFDKENTIHIALHGSAKDSRSLELFFDRESTLTLPIQQSTEETKISGATYLPFVFHWKMPNRPDVILKARSTAAGLQIEGFIHESNIRSAFIPAHAQTSQQYTAALYSNLSKQNKEGDFVAALKLQFPDIQKVSVELEAGVSAIFVSIKWLNQKIPLGLYSNAGQNLASILLNIAASPAGIVCVDEVENGFHYSRFARVWDQIYTFADLFETQIFASTHSAECIEALIPIAEKHSNDIAIIQMHQKNGISSATVISGDDVRAAVSHGIEVRT